MPKEVAMSFYKQELLVVRISVFFIINSGTTDLYVQQMILPICQQKLKHIRCVKMREIVK